jgi:hypothetical protein
LKGENHPGSFFISPQALNVMFVFTGTAVKLCPDMNKVILIKTLIIHKFLTAEPHRDAKLLVSLFEPLGDEWLVLVG